MQGKQLEFFQRLQAPFPPERIRTRTQAGRSLDYITSRDVFNRLDEVCGPAGWKTEYSKSPFGDGAICKLILLVPVDEEAEEWQWIGKEDGGAMAGMSEEDNNEKSGFSDALKRAGVVWGIGRNLYKVGMPSYMDGVDTSESSPRQGTRERPAAATGHGGTRPPQENARGGFNLASIPKHGTKGTFAWIKNLEKHFGIELMNGVKAIAKKNGATSDFTNDWDEEVWLLTVREMIGRLKAKEFYKGEFDGVTEEQLTPTEIDYSRI